MDKEAEKTNKPKRDRREYNKRLYEMRKEEIKKRVKDAYHANPEEKKAKVNEYASKNRRKIADRMKQYYQDNRSEIREKRKEYNKNYVNPNPEKVKETQRKGSIKRHSIYRDIRIMTEQRFGGKCCVCGVTENLQFHHKWYGEEGKQKDKASTTDKLLFMQEVEEHPERFELLCAACHSAITGVTTFIEVDIHNSSLLEVMLETLKFQVKGGERDE